MITGDQALTACHVAAQVHIVTRAVLVLTQQSGDGVEQFEWRSPDEKIKMAYKYEHFPLVWLVELGAIYSTLYKQVVFFSNCNLKRCSRLMSQQGRSVRGGRGPRFVYCGRWPGHATTDQCSAASCSAHSGLYPFVPKFLTRKSLIPQLSIISFMVRRSEGSRYLFLQ